MSTIIVNVIVIAIETGKTTNWWHVLFCCVNYKIGQLTCCWLYTLDWANDNRVLIYSKIFAIFNNVFLAIYLFEFMVKVFAAPMSYWKNGFNLFDFVVLIFSLVQWISEMTQTSPNSLDIINSLKGIHIYFYPF